MLKNYLKTTLRNLRKFKAYSLINIAGLAIGLACCLLIMLYVQHELTYDRHHEHADRIYRIAADIYFGGNHLRMATAPAPMAPTMVNDFPEVLQSVRFRGQGSFLVKAQAMGQNFKEERVIFADSTLFEVFTMPMLAGDPETALRDPGAVVISRSTAAKYFGDEDAVGQMLIFDNRSSYQVTGVFADMPENSHFRFDLIASLASLEESRNNLWVSNNFRSYLLLAPGADAGALEAKFPAIVEKYMGPMVRELTGAGFSEFLAKGNRVRYYLQPLCDIHLHSDLTAEFQPNGNMQYIYIFSAIAFFILLIACINFMNLSTARSAGRAREVGVRKVVGSHRLQLIGQFLAESVFLSMLALLVAIGLVAIILPFFNNFAGMNLELLSKDNWSLLLTIVIVAGVVGIFAGSYPAFVLSSFRPVQVLKGNTAGRMHPSRLRSALVVFQFSISIILIVGTLIIASQLRYVQSKNLGFDREQVIMLHDVYALGSQVEAFKNEVLRHPDIISATVTGYLPINSNRSDMGFWPDGRRDADPVSMQIWSVDHDYVKTLGMEIVAGRDFAREFGADSSAIIINERAATVFGFDDPLGKRIFTFDYTPGIGMDPNRTIGYTIIGVLRDFHFESLKSHIGALGLRLGRSNAYLSCRFRTENVASIIAGLQEKWQAFSPEQPFAYSFLDDRFSAMYKNERRIGELFGLFATLAIVTACLGLFGLASYTAEQRTKEIGVRKVLGASVPGVVALLSKDFIKLVLVANLIAWPVAWLVMQRWLGGFAYRTDIGWWIYAAAGLLALIIALLTVSWQAIRASLLNPTQALRYE